MALRYPKTHYIETIRGVQGGMNNSTSGTAPYTAQFQNNDCVILAPSRYSEVRKVSFSICTGKLGTGTTMTAALKVGTWSSTTPILNVEKFTLPVSTVVQSGTDHGFNGTNRAQFSRDGDTETIVQAGVTAQERDHAQLLTIEFDRFSPQDTDFFAAWDAFDSDDDYIVFHPFVKVLTADGTPMTVRFKTFQCTVIQAPAQSNDSNSDWPSYIGTRDEVESTTAYQGAAFGPRMPFHYFADDWDEIQSVTAVVTGSNNGGATLFVQVYDITAAAQVFEETFDVSAGGDFHVARTQDFFSSLIDGHLYRIDYRLNAAPGIVDPRGSGFFSIVQKGFSRTVSAHHLSGLDFTPTAVTETPMQAILFDPLWYEDFTNEQILKRKMFSAFIHNAGANNPRQSLRIDAALRSDDSARGSGTAADITPEHTFTGLPISEGKFQFTDILSNDPIDLAGSRRIQKSFLGSSTWLAGIGDFPGHMGLYYVLEVPSEEAPELGPVFELGQFNPEGCASTAAGLGDNPGVLGLANGSTPPKKFDPRAQQISNLGLEPPFCDENPSPTTGSVAASPSSGLDLGLYRYRYTFRNSCTGSESDPSPADLVVDTSGESPAAEVTLSFAGVVIPNDPQVDEICVYRTLEGGAFPIMAKVGCFNFTDTTLFVDTIPDDELDFLNKPLSILNGFAPCAPVIAEFRNRLFLMGDIPQLSPAGTVDVVQDSDIMTFSADAEIDRCIVGRFIQLQGDCKAYEVEKILTSSAGSPSTPRVQLTEPFEGDNSTGNLFTICGRPNRIHISEPLLPDSWPASNFIDVEPGDGDRIMGAVSNFNGMVICKRRKTYVLRFSVNPATEVVVPARVSSDIGCIGPRTFAQIANGSVWLADRGIAMFDGRGVRHVEESDSVNDLLTNPDNPRYIRKDRNGRVIGAIGAFYPKREQYLLLLPTVQTSRGANLMLVWDTSLKNITFYEFCQEFVSMEVAKDDEGNERVYMGDTNGFVWILDVGDTDGVGFPGSTGTVRGRITSAGVDADTGASFLEDTNASFLVGGVPSIGGLSGIAGLSGFDGGSNMGLAGACVFFRRFDADKDDPWRHKVVYASTSNRLYVTPNWGVDAPDGGSVFEYMLGPIEFMAEFKPRNYDTDDFQKRDWQQIVTHVPESIASELRVELIPDFQNSDPEEDTVIDPVTDETGKGRVFRMDFPSGRQIAPVGRLIHNFQQVRLRNFAPEEPIRILNHTLRIIPKTSR
jgi:hypothetical protein